MSQSINFQLCDIWTFSWVEPVVSTEDSVLHKDTTSDHSFGQESGTLQTELFV